MNRYAIVKDGVVINIIIWDGISEWNHGHEDVQIVQSNSLNVGDNYSPEQQ